MRSGRRLRTGIGVVLAASVVSGAWAARQGIDANRRTVEAKIAAELPSLEALYKQLHQAPELSLQEEKTAAQMARELRSAGFAVTEKVGGHGVVGVLKNGAGPTVLVRTDLDGLPVNEATGLPYASKARARDRSGTEVSVMHACGHDMHMACWVGTARTLAGMKDRWKGTLLFIAQPAEEIGAGARAMLGDGLLRRFPRPDYCLALHCDALYPAGQVAYTVGPALANVDSVDITVRGRGGHGAYPHTTVDPVVLAARIVLDLQTLVSRERNPLDPVVLTVGSIHGGTKHNIIPHEVQLQITLRTTSDASRKEMLAGIERIAKAAAQGARAPEPVVKWSDTEFTPVTVNDAALTRRLAALFWDVLGKENVQEKPLVMGGEDFGRYGGEGIPSAIYWLGTVPPGRVAEAGREGGKPLPSLHSDEYAPAIDPTLKTGVFTMSMAVLDLLRK